MTTPRLGAPELVTSQDVPETTVNEQIRYCEQGSTRFLVVDRDLATPPGSPADGAAYIVASSPTGAWTGWTGRIAFYAAGWESIAPQEGMRAYVQDESTEVEYNGTIWTTPSTLSIDLDDINDVDTTGVADGDVLTYDSGSGDWVAATPSAGTVTETFIIACSDESTAITTGTAKVTFRMPYAFTLTAVRASVTTAPTGSTIIIDINESGSTILSTKLSIDASEKTSTTAASTAVISDSGLADDAEITIDFDAVGSTVAGAGVKVYLIGHQ